MFSENVSVFTKTELYILEALYNQGRKSHFIVRWGGTINSNISESNFWGVMKKLLSGPISLSLTLLCNLPCCVEPSACSNVLNNGIKVIIVVIALFHISPYPTCIQVFVCSTSITNNGIMWEVAMIHLI